MSVKVQINDLLKETYGRADYIAIPVPILHFCDRDYSLSALIMQIIYWTNITKMKNKWFAKSYKEWFKEIGLKRSTLRRKEEMIIEVGFIETKIKKFNGAPTVHYRLNAAYFLKALHCYLMNHTLTLSKIHTKISQDESIDISKLQHWIDQIWDHEIIQNSTNHIPNLSQTITKTTSKNTSKIFTEKGKTSPHEKMQSFSPKKNTDEEKEKSCAKKEKDEIIYPYEDPTFKKMWEAWKTTLFKNHNKKYTHDAEQAALFVFSEYEYPIDFAKEILRKAIANNWKSFHFENTYNKFLNINNRHELDKQKFREEPNGIIDRIAKNW